MMTTFILHGGRTTKDSPDNDLFFKSFTQFVEKDEVTILICLFAREKEKWETRLQTINEKIKKQTTKKFSLTLTTDPEDLLKKLQTHDILYVDGGEAVLIEPLLSQLKPLQEKLQGKVYIGSSMGAFIVSSHYVLSFDEQDISTVHKGLGVLSINTLCHWDIENKKELKVGLLKKEASEIPILTLEEGKFATFIN